MRRRFALLAQRAAFCTLVVLVTILIVLHLRRPMASQKIVMSTHTAIPGYSERAKSLQNAKDADDNVALGHPYGQRNRLSKSGKTTSEKQIFGPRLEVPDQHTERFTLGGSVFGEHGPVKQLTSVASTSLLHSFSPQTENHFRNIMADPQREHTIFANSPAIAWHHDTLVVVMRIWLHKESWHEKVARGDPDAPKNSFLDNYLYMQKFDRQLRPLAPGEVLGIPTPVQWNFGEGPLEPRLFLHAGHLYLSYNAGVVMNSSRSMDTTLLWDFDRKMSLLPSFVGGKSPMEKLHYNGMVRDKHWIPFDDKNNEDPSALYFTYNIDPLKIMKLNTQSGVANITYFEGPEIYPFSNPRDIVRGGTPFLEYKHPYYVSLGHGTLFIDPNYERIYIAYILVLRAENPHYKIAYKSDPIRIHEEVLNRFPIVRGEYIKQPFIFPMSLLLEDEDTCAFGTHVNDYGSVLLRFRGLKEIMEGVMAADEGVPCKGPPVGFLHTITREYMSQRTGLKFFGANK